MGEHNRCGSMPAVMETDHWQAADNQIMFALMLLISACASLSSAGLIYG